MTRRGSRTEARQTTGGRPAVAYTTNAPPPNAAVLICACGSKYRDYPDSMAAHLTVFGHRPIRKPAPATDETRPGEAGARASGDASSANDTAESAPDRQGES